MGVYRFAREWEVDAPRDQVFAALVGTEDWPRWWRWLDDVRTLHDPGDGPVGRTQRFQVRAPLGYALEIDGRFTHVDRPRRLESDLDGHLAGHGTMDLEEVGPRRTRLTYRVEVEAAHPWMRRLEPVLRPAFAWAHHQVVDAAVRGLQRKLDHDR